MKFNKVVDNGVEHTIYEGGAEREVIEGRGRFDLIPPELILALAIHYENGAKKYADRNWEKGIPFSSLMNSTKRHINKLEFGLRDEDHICAAIWNLAAMLTFIERGRTDLIDIPALQDAYVKEK